MVFIVAASSLYHSLEQFSDPEKKLLKISAFPGLSKPENKESTTKPRDSTSQVISTTKITRDVEVHCHQ